MTSVTKATLCSLLNMIICLAMTFLAMNCVCMIWQNVCQKNRAPFG